MRPDMEWTCHPNTKLLLGELDTVRTAVHLAARESASRLYALEQERKALAAALEERDMARYEAGVLAEKWGQAVKERDAALARALAAERRADALDERLRKELERKGGGT